MRSYTGVLLANIVLIFIFYNTIGMYSEDISEIYHAALHNALFLSHPEHVFNNCNVFFLLTYPVVFLKEYFPRCNVHGYFLILLTCVFLTNYFILLCDAVQRQPFIAHKRKISLLLFFLVFLVLFNDIFTVQYTRIAIHLIVSGILLYNLSGSVFVRIASFVSVVAGLLLRFEGFLVVVPVLTVFFIFRLGQDKISSILALFKRNLVFLFVFAGIIVLTNFSYTKDDKTYEPYRAIIYALADFQTGNANLTLRNKQDSVKFDMAQYYFFNDLDSLGVEDMYRLGIKPVDREPLDAFSNFDFSFRIKTGFRFFADFLIFNGWLIAAVFICIVLLALAGNINLFKAGSVFAAAILLILLTAVYIKIEQRVSVPLLGLSFLLTILIVLDAVSEEKKRLFPVLMIIAGIFFFVNLKDNYTLYKSRVYTEKEIVRLDTYFKSHPEIKVVYWDPFLYTLFFNKIASDCDLYNPERDYAYDNSLICLFDGYQQRMKDRFGTFKFIDLISQAADDKGIVIFSAEEKMKLLTEYLKYQYHKDIKAVKVEENPVYQSHTQNIEGDFYLYYLSN